MFQIRNSTFFVRYLSDKLRTGAGLVLKVNINMIDTFQYIQKCTHGQLIVMQYRGTTAGQYINRIEKNKKEQNK